MTSTAEFVETLRQLGLLSADQLTTLVREQAGFADARACAIELNRRGWLTFYQVDQLIGGKGSELKLGPYVVLERLGEGGLGTVYKARHARMGRIVALKVIRKERLPRPADVERFHKEIEAAAQLAHPNTVQAFAADQVGDVHYFAMEYVEGLDLHKRVKQRGPLPVLEACEYIRQAALGLHHAHERGLIHGDLKPSNLIVCKSTAGELPVVKILDLGLAGEAAGRLTRDSADFLSPEQTTQAGAADVRSDLYSLGCTLFFLLAGKPPFADGSVAEKLEKHRKEEPPPIDKLRADVPPRAGAIVHRLMAKRPQDRYASADAVALALAELGRPELNGRALLVGLKRLVVAALVRLYRLARAHPRWAAGLFVVFVVLVVWLRTPGEPLERPHKLLGYNVRKHPPQAASFGKHWYLYVPDKVDSWEEAQERCKRLGGYLACISSKEENDFLIALTGGSHYWLGGRNDDKRAWSWVNGEPFGYTGWANGQPNNGVNVYLEMYQGGWHDIGRKEQPVYAAGFVCEFDF